MFYLLVFILVQNCYTTTCNNWFNSLKLIPSPKCLFKCLSAPTGMATFNCTKKCPEFCKEKNTNDPNSIYRLAYYSGLTIEELKLIKKYPEKAYLVYKQKKITEKLSKKYFKRIDVNDESDAFRHFVWAALLVKEIEPDLAEVY